MRDIFLGVIDILKRVQEINIELSSPSMVILLTDLNRRCHHFAISVALIPYIPEPLSQIVLEQVGIFP